MNLALPNYLMLITKCQMSLNRLYIPHWSNAWLKLNAQLKLYKLSYLSVFTVKRFFNLNSKSFLLVWTKNIPKSIHVNIFLPSLTFFSHSGWWNRITGSLLIQFLPVNCSFSESSISLQCSCKVSFVDRCTSGNNSRSTIWNNHSWDNLSCHFSLWNLDGSVFAAE